MASPFQQLQKILKHEAQDGYRNRIVIGGMGRFADHWYRQARAALQGGGSGAPPRPGGDLCGPAAL
jgi:hypothetical protein